MSNEESESKDSIEVESRTERALTECMTVVSTEGTPVTDADEETVSVVSSSGSTYTVDAGDEFCDCPDYQHNHRRCKHIRRARFALGIDELSAATLRTLDIAENFAAHCPGPIVVASDGGRVGESKTRNESNEDKEDTLAAIIEDRGPRRGTCCDVCGCRVKGGFYDNEVVCHDCAKARRRNDRHTILSRIRTYGGGSEVDEHTTLSDLGVSQ
jgi:predicted nucleic acid-binding Zn finger protein